MYATVVKTLAERMAIAPVAGIGDDAQAGSTVANAARPETSIVALSGDYVLQISVDRAGKSAEGALQAPLAEVARRAIGNIAATSEKFGGCDWLTADDAGVSRSRHADDRAHWREQLHDVRRRRQYHDGCSGQLSRDTQVSMIKRDGGCKHVALPELGGEAFGEHSCSGGNGNAVDIYAWKKGRQASILFAPAKPHPESGAVERLIAVAARIYGKL